MQETVSQRFKKLVEIYADGNRAVFARKVGMKEPTLGSIITGANQNVSTKTLIPIAEKYPEVDMNWLVAGQGAIHKPSYYVGDKNNQVFQASSNNIVGDNMELQKENIKLEKRILELERENWELKKRLEQTGE